MRDENKLPRLKISWKDKHRQLNKLWVSILLEEAPTSSLFKTTQYNNVTIKLPEYSGD